MKTLARNLIALLCNAKPKPGERLVACSPCSVVMAADAAPDAALPTEIVWMPKGDHEISAGTMAGGNWCGMVRCDELGSSVVIASYQRVITAGLRVWIDCNHDDGAAMAWVRGFSWDPARGIVAKVEWTSEGAECLTEKLMYSFSPTFWVDWESGRVAGLVEGHAAGGLVNAPAFGADMPALIAARLAGAEKPNVNPAPDGFPGISKTNTKMKDLLIKILVSMGVEVPPDATDEQLAALVDKAIGEATADADASKENKELAAKLAVVASLKQQVDALNDSAKAQKKKSAEAAVQASVDRGAIKADDTALRARYVALIEADESNIAILAALPGTAPAQSVVIASDASQRTSAANIQVLNASLVDSLKAYAARKTPAERAAVYAASISPVLRDPSVRLGPILAANSLGGLSGDLVTQRALTLLKLSFPALGAISTDFSDAGAKKGQTVMSRIKVVPTASDYVAGTGYTTSDAVTANVPVIINNHKGVEISFNADELGSTDRDLFGEQAEGANYALGKAMVDAIYALLTTANFPKTITTAGDGETISTLANFGRATLIDVASQLGLRGVPQMGRFALLNSAFFGQLGKDAGIISLAAFQRPELLTEYMLPKVAGFQPYEAPNLITANTLTGFCGTPDSLVIATRVPNDYTLALPGANNGAVTTITNPDTGITVQITQFVDHKKASAYWRVAVMFGAAVGNSKAGHRLVTAATA